MSASDEAKEEARALVLGAIFTYNTDAEIHARVKRAISVLRASGLGRRVLDEESELVAMGATLALTLPVP